MYTEASFFVRPNSSGFSDVAQITHQKNKTQSGFQEFKYLSSQFEICPVDSSMLEPLRVKECLEPLA